MKAFELKFMSGGRLRLSEFLNRLKPQRLRIPPTFDDAEMLRVRRSILRKFSRRINRQDCGWA